MQKYQRSFAIWLLVVGIVGVHSRFVTNDISVDDQVLDGIDYDKSSLYPAELDSSFPDTEAVPENEHVEKSVQKRSNPQGSKKMSEKDFSWHVNEGEKVMRREMMLTAAERLAREQAAARQQQQFTTAGSSKSQNTRQQNQAGPSGKKH